jgi:hypothetical protein
MDTFYSSGVSATPPPLGTGVKGFPKSGANPTTMGAGWAHSVTMEIVNAIVAGGLVPDVNSVTQLAEVIYTLVDADTAMNQKIQDAFDRIMPYGTVIPWNSMVIPYGFIKANGALLPRSGNGSFPKLTTEVLADRLAIATEADWSNFPMRYTKGDGSSNIRVPDYRNLIIKGFHDNSSARTVPDNLNYQLGQLQLDMNKEHTHGGVPANLSDTDRGTGGSSLFSLDNQATTWSDGGPETRVKTGSALYILRAYQ